MTPDSPRILALHEALLAGGGHAAEERFWELVKAEGAPLVDSPGSEWDPVVLTFFWRAGPGVKGVALAGGPAGPLPVTLDRLGDSDVWYRSFRAPPDSRFTYFFLENPDPEWLGPARGSSPSRLQMLENTRTDPLNDALVEVMSKEDSPIGRAVTASVCELPAAPPLWSERRAGVAAGALDSHWLESEILGNRRRMWVHRPAGEREPQGLLIALDGAIMARPVVNLPVILDNLYAEGLVPPLLSVMVEQPHPASKSRLEELACNERFLRFVAEESLPWIEESTGLVRRPPRTIVAGMSLGGLAAGFCGVSRPDLFENVLSVAGSFWWGPEGEDPEWLVRRVGTAPEIARRWYLEAGLFDTSLEAPSDVLRSNRALRDALAGRGVEVEYREFSGGHDVICCGTSLANGLQALTKDW